MMRRDQANLPRIEADRALVERLLAGEEAAFERLFEDNHDGLYRFALTRLRGDEELAQEMAQAAFVKAIEKLETYRGEAALFSWLCTFCRFEISAHFRRTKWLAPGLDSEGAEAAGQTVLDAMALAAPGPEDELHRQDVVRLVHQTLDELPPTYGRALEWKYVGGLSVQEIAARLELSPKAAESLLTRARAAFRKGFATLSEEPKGRGKIDFPRPVMERS